MRLKAYIKNHSDMEIYGIYIDDGYSGVSFGDRPGFQKMMSDVYAGKGTERSNIRIIFY